MPMTIRSRNLRQLIAVVCCVSFATTHILMASPYESQIAQIEVKFTTSKFVRPLSEVAIPQFAKLSDSAKRIAPPSKLPARDWLLDDVPSEGSSVPELALHAPVAVATEIAGEDWSWTYVVSVVAVAVAVVAVVVTAPAWVPVIAAAVVVVAAVWNAAEVLTEPAGSAALAEAQAEAAAQANANQQQIAAQANVATPVLAQQQNALVAAAEQVAATVDPAVAAQTLDGIGWAQPHDTKALESIAAKRNFMLLTELDLPVYAL